MWLPLHLASRGRSGTLPSWPSPLVAPLLATRARHSPAYALVRSYCEVSPRNSVMCCTETSQVDLKKVQLKKINILHTKCDLTFYTRVYRTSYGSHIIRSVTETTSIRHRCLIKPLNCLCTLYYLLLYIIITQEHRWRRYLP